MKKLFSVLFACLLVMPVFADDDDTDIVTDDEVVVTQSVSARRTCAEIKAEIDKIAAMDEPTDADTEKLAADRDEYRTKCTARAGARVRRGSAPAPVYVPAKPDTETHAANNDTPATKTVAAPAPAPAATAPIASNNTDMTPADVTSPDAAVATVPEAPQKTEEEIAAEIEANVNAGLCPNGDKPNRFGCCANETFKDMGKQGFNCCPNDGGDCYPPIK